MMKLKNLVVNTDSAALEILKNWEYDEKTLMFWRSSANIVYRYKYNDSIYFLRFSHEEENVFEQISAEIDFLLYLKQNNYPANYPVKSKAGNYVETVKTELGTYYAVVFSEEKGEHMEIENMTQEQVINWGKSLSTLHILSEKYKPSNYVRKSWKDVMQYIDDILLQFPEERAAIKESDSISNILGSFPINNENYGLVHYDYETDNVFWDEKLNKFSVIDFDDSMYHWYVMDIIRALDDIPQRKDSHSKEIFEWFIKGYRMLKEVDEELISQSSVFVRFANLYIFARLLRTLKDSDFQDEPDWLKTVRPRLINRCNMLRKGF